MPIIEAHELTKTYKVFQKQPGLFGAIAGLWSRAMIDGSAFDTFAIVTTEPNGILAGLSATSMPVILDRSNWLRWLDTEARDPRALLRPYPSDAMHGWPANPAVGNVRNQGEDLLG
mgnify:CR=1 FL=1